MPLTSAECYCRNGYPAFAAILLKTKLHRERAVEIAEILNELELYREYYPKDAVEEALRNQRDITPHLLRSIEIAIDKAESIAHGDSKYYLYFFAIHILASFREIQAYPLIIKMCRLPAYQLEALLGDALFESIPRILAAVCDGDIEPIKSIIKDSSLAENARASAITSLRCILLEDIIPGEAVIDYFGYLFRGGLERKHSNCWNVMLTESMDIYAESLKEEIFRAFDDDLIDTGFVNRADVNRTFNMSESVVLRQSRKYWGGLIDDVHSYLGNWACFKPDPELMATPEREPGIIATGTYVKEGSKTGRNDPCPCGSGRKYKKCCGR